jgi:phosphoribosylformimino-5-aminoimidazole carboxamide ribonucleotide (ProFAR) isomerase
MKKVTQREMRQSIEVGGGLRDVTNVTGWYRVGHFKTDEAAAGAFELAYQQGMDGMGKSVAAWMGMTESYNEWMRNKTLPPKK